MSFVEIDIPEGKKFDNIKFQLPKEEIQRAVIVGLIDLGEHDTGFKDKNGNANIRPKLMVQFELVDDLLTEGENAGKPLMITQEFTLSRDVKSKLRYMLIDTLVGHKTTDDEVAKFKLSTVVGKAVMLGIAHRKKTNVAADNPNTHYAYIASIAGVHKSVAMPEAVHEPFVLSLKAFDKAVFDKLPKWIQDKVNLSSIPEDVKPPVAF